MHWVFNGIGWLTILAGPVSTMLAIVLAATTPSFYGSAIAFCSRCGYPRAGLSNDTSCPECGLPGALASCFVAARPSGLPAILTFFLSVLVAIGALVFAINSCEVLQDTLGDLVLGTGLVIAAYIPTTVTTILLARRVGENSAAFAAVLGSLLTGVVVFLITYDLAMPHSYKFSALYRVPFAGLTSSFALLPVVIVARWNHLRKFKRLSAAPINLTPGTAHG